MLPKPRLPAPRSGPEELSACRGTAIATPLRYDHAPKRWPRPWKMTKSMGDGHVSGGETTSTPLRNGHAPGKRPCLRRDDGHDARRWPRLRKRRWSRPWEMAKSRPEVDVYGLEGAGGGGASELTGPSLCWVLESTDNGRVYHFTY